MTHSLANEGAATQSYYRRRIAYAAKVFGITLRLAGVILLIVQIVQAVMKIADGGSVSPNIAIGCAIALGFLWASRRSAMEKSMARFAQSSRQLRTKRIFYVIPFLLVLLVVVAKLIIGPVSDEWRYVSSEGSLSEYGTALAYLLVPFFGFPMIKLFRRQNKRLMALLFTLFVAGAFFVGMEEISWGQRLLGFEEPEFISKHNVQSEFTFHNLSFFQNYMLQSAFILVGFVGSCCWIVLRRRQEKQRKAAGPNSSPKESKLDLSYFFPDWPISSYFYPVFLIELMVEFTPYGSWHTFHAAGDHEHWEFIMGIGVLLFVVVNFFRQGRNCDLQAANRNEPIDSAADYLKETQPTG